MRDQVDVGDPIPASDINLAYKNRFSIDVSRFFVKEHVTLEAVAPHNYYVFRHALAGDSQFYSDLMRRIGYDDGDKAEFVAAKDYVRDNDRVLDIGCGPGRFSNFCGDSYKGVELNPDAVAEAHRHGRNVALERLEDQPAGAFDVVTMFQVLEHVTEPEAFVREAALRVAPGGALIISTPDMSGYMASNLNHILNYPPHHMSWWTADSISALMAANAIVTEVVWKEKLQPLHVTDWVESTLFPRRRQHFDFSAKAKLKRAIAKVGSFLVGPALGEAAHVTGQCVMVVGRRKN